MKVIGVTGLIGSGKSIVMKLFRKLYDIPTFDSDQNAKDIYYDKNVRQKIFNQLGFDPINNDGALNKEGLRHLVTSDPQKKRCLEAIVHESLGENFKRWLKRQDSNLVIIESAILFTSEFNKFCDQTIQVTAQKETRRKRVLSRDQSMTDKRFEQIVDIQREEAKRQADESDYTIDNDGGISIVRQVENTYKKICKRNFKQ